MVSETESPPDTMPRQVCRTLYPHSFCPCGTHALIWDALIWERMGQEVAEPEPELPGAHVEVFLDLARAGREQDFKDLAGALGVPGVDHDSMWRGTVRRVTPA